MLLKSRQNIHPMSVIPKINPEINPQGEVSKRWSIQNPVKMGTLNRIAISPPKERYSKYLLDLGSLKWSLFLF